MDQCITLFTSKDINESKRFSRFINKRYTIPTFVLSDRLDSSSAVVVDRIDLMEFQVEDSDFYRFVIEALVSELSAACQENAKIRSNISLRNILSSISDN